MPLHDNHPGWSDRGFLPHRDEPGLIQSVTFRLADSMPLERREEWEHLLKIQDRLERIEQTEAWLDQGAGSCVLRQPAIGRMVHEALQFFDRQRYSLKGWCVMPNHVHVLFEVWPGHPLGKVIHSWKTFTTREINKILGDQGAKWQEDYFDRFMRDEEHFASELNYIERNPVAAGLVHNAADWPWSSAASDGARVC